MTEIPSALHTYLTTAPTSAFRHRTVEMVDSWQGTDNLLWRVACDSSQAVVKLFLDAGQARSRRQYAGHQTFAPLGLAPRPLWTDRYPEGLSHQILVYEWASGVAIDPQDPGQMVALAQIVAQIHGSDPEQVGRISPNPVNLDYAWRVTRGSIRPIEENLQRAGAAQSLALFQRMARNAESLLAKTSHLWPGVAPAPIHGELKLENSVISFGQPLLVDWERFGLGDPAQEAANFLLYGGPVLTAEMAELWLDVYLEQLDQPGLPGRVQLYCTFLPFQTLCYLLDGLRSLSADDLSEAEGPEMVDFLKHTLVAGIQAASHALMAEDVADAIKLEIERLVEQRIANGPWSATYPKS